MTIIKDIVTVLAEGIPAWLRGLFIALCILLIGLWALGFNYETYKSAKYLQEIKDNSILLSNRSLKDKNVQVDESAEQLYIKLSHEYNVIGVSVVSFEPEIQPKVLKVIAKDGNKDFERAIVVGSERYLSGGVMSLFLANREGINYMSNVIESRLVKEIGVKSVIAMPIIYRGICVGSVVLFLGDSVEMIDEQEYEYLNGSTKIETHQILEKLYYSR